MIRLARLLRIFKLLRRIRALKLIVASLGKASIAVANALALLFTFTVVYSIVGTHLYREVSPAYFGNLGSSLFTLSQVVTADAWGSNIARSMFNLDADCSVKTEGGTRCSPPFSISIFFILFVLIASIVLLNVVVAVCATAQSTLLTRLSGGMVEALESRAILVEDSEFRAKAAIHSILKSCPTVYTNEDVSGDGRGFRV